MARPEYPQHLHEKNSLDVPEHTGKCKYAGFSPKPPNVAGKPANLHQFYAMVALNPPLQAKGCTFRLLENPCFLRSGGDVHLPNQNLAP
ncbi:hypothetical protein, partial [Paenibacillus dendritiformis]|uniref:hypothetical protein n=1 Tax=Paenibacillus dendritiformis TaxID=130049 RepID=UPI00387E08AE